MSNNITASFVADKAGFKLTDTPSKVATKAGKSLAKFLGADERYIYVVGERRGGSIASGLSDGMTFAAGHGTGYTENGAELIAEELPDDFLYDLASELNDALEFRDCPVRCEPATGYALSFWKES